MVGELRVVRRVSEDREEEHRLSATFVHAPIAMTHVALDGTFLAINPKMTELTGYSEEELVGRPVAEITLPSDIAGDRPFFQAAREGRELQVREKRYRCKDGRVVMVRLRSALVRDEQRELSYLVNVVEDLDLLRAQEESHQQAQKMDQLGRMAGGIAHDFNNLLAVIMSYSSGLADDPTLGTEQRADAEEIRATARRGVLLTRQLLAFSRREPLRSRAIDPIACITGLERLLQPLLGDEVVFSWHVAEGTPPCLADQSQLEQVLMNLTINARDAMNGKGTLWLEARSVAVRPDNPHGLEPGVFAAFELRDTGCGIAPEVLSHVFEPFFTTKERGKGTGLGLATVQAIVHRLGGAVEVRSTVGVGTTFTVLLPLAPEDAPRDAEEELPSTPEAVNHGEHLLLVEDDPAVRKLMQVVLARAGYRVTVASNGAEGLFIASQPGVELDGVVTDIEMPLLNGIELITRLESSHPRLRGLLVSAAFGNHQVPAPMPRLGKPFSRTELLDAVAKLFRP